MDSVSSKRITILVISGPNLNLLGRREPAVYGTGSYADLCAYVQAEAEKQNVAVEFYQSNHEGDLVDCIQGALDRVDGILINPAAYTHTSIAIPDALRAVGIPAVEVHLSDVDNREPYRRVSYTRDACIAAFKGLGFGGYAKALALLSERLQKKES